MKTTAKFLEWDAPIRRLIRRMCRELEADPIRRGRVDLNEIAERVEKDLGVALPRRTMNASGPIQRLVDSGAVARFQVLEKGREFGNGGGSYRYRATDIDEINLATLWDLADSCVSEEKKGRPGRRSTSELGDTREVLEISKSQRDKIRLMCERVVLSEVPSARPAPGETSAERSRKIREGMKRIGAETFMWNSTAGANEAGDWESFIKVVRKAAPESLLSQDIGSARTLCDLAATHGFLVRTELHGGKRMFLPASWGGPIGEWLLRVKEAGLAQRSLGSWPYLYIMSAMAECFAPQLARIDPLCLDKDQSATFARYLRSLLDNDASLTGHRRSAVLACLRNLSGVGILHDIPITDFDRRRIDGRKSAFENGAIKALAKKFGMECKARDRDYTLFQQLGPGPFFNPKKPYSLPHLVDFFTLRGTARTRRGLPAANCFPRAQIRRAGGKSGTLWRSPTLHIHLELLGTYLGYVEHYHEVDLSVADARTIFTRELLEDFVDAVDDDEWTTPYRALDILYHVSLYCSPCWETQAIEEGDSAAADHFAALADFAAGRGTRNPRTEIYDGLTLYDTQKSAWGQDSDQVEDQKKRALLVRDSYQEVFGIDYAYDAMILVRDAALARLAEDLAVPSIEELMAQIVDGRRLGYSDCKLIRDIAMWADSLAAPLRNRAIRFQTLGMRTERSDGRLQLSIPKTLMKVPHADYEIQLGHRGREPQDGYSFLLYDLYGLARPFILNGDSTDYYFVGRDGGALAAPLSSGTVTRCFREVIEYASAWLDVDPTPITSRAGLSGSHPIRHAVGSFFVGHDQPETARLLLHHKGYDQLLKVYAAPSRDVSASAARARANAKAA